MSEKRNWKVFASADEQSRRQMITHSIFGAGSLAMVRAEGHETSSESAGTKTIIIVKAIHHELDFHSSPQRIYEALLTPRSSRRFQEVVRRKSIAKLVALSQSSRAISWDETLS